VGVTGGFGWFGGKSSYCGEVGMDNRVRYKYYSLSMVGSTSGGVTTT